MSGEEQPQERFVQIDTFLNTVIDVGGRLIYSQEFTKACLESAYDDFGSRLYNKLRARNISVDYSSVNLGKITDARGVPAKLLRPGLPWVDGRVRVKLVAAVEFEPEDPGSASSESPLDPFREDTG